MAFLQPGQPLQTYLITLSARWSTSGGIFIPIAALKKNPDELRVAANTFVDEKRNAIVTLGNVETRIASETAFSREDSYLQCTLFS